MGMLHQFTSKVVIGKNAKTASPYLIVLKLDAKVKSQRPENDAGLQMQQILAKQLEFEQAYECEMTLCKLIEIWLMFTKKATALLFLNKSYKLHRNVFIMKRLTIFLLAVALFGQSFAAFVTKSEKAKASEVKVTLSAGTQVSVTELSTMSLKEFEKANGKKLNFLEKKVFKMSQRKLSRMIDADGNIDQKAMDQFAAKEMASTGDFNFGGFILGLLLSIIGVLIAYIIDGKGSSLVKWAWIGAAVNLAIWLLLALI
jgi:hypothetical protein